MDKDSLKTLGSVLDAEQAKAIAGGEGSCTTTVTFSGPGFEVSSTYNSFESALVGTYDGIVGATSHVIETVANAIE